MQNKNRSEVNIVVLFFVISLGCFIVHLLFFRDSFPLINVDEGSFLSPAYSFAKHGILSSNIHQSFLPGSSTYTYWMPPLYLVLLGSFLKVVGITVLNAKILSILFTCASAYLITRLSLDKYIKLCLISLLLICPFIILTSAFIRVEALAILLIIISIVALHFNSSAWLLGVIAGLGLMTHPLLLPCAAALGIIVMRRGIKPLIIFSIVVLITLSPYFFYIFKDIELFKEQMALQLSRKSKAKLSDLKLLYILQSVPFTLLALYCLSRIKQSKELRLFLAVALVLSTVVILRSNEFNYQVYIVPYLLAAMGLLMQEKQENKLLRYGMPLVVYLFFGVTLLSKLYKNHFENDVEYKEMITYLNQNKSWNGKEIFVAGGPDISTYLLVNDQHVERQIPIALNKQSDWFNRYNYVVEVNDNTEKLPANNMADSANQKPWLTWSKKYSFTTSKGSHVLSVFEK